MDEGATVGALARKPLASGSRPLLSECRSVDIGLADETMRREDAARLIAEVRGATIPVATKLWASA